MTGNEFFRSNAGWVMKMYSICCLMRQVDAFNCIVRCIDTGTCPELREVAFTWQANPPVIPVGACLREGGG